MSEVSVVHGKTPLSAHYLVVGVGFHVASAFAFTNKNIPTQEKTKNSWGYFYL